MKVVYWLMGIALGVPVFLVCVIYAASELGGEVVTLDRAEPIGDASKVRIWIVDQGGTSWVEHGDADSHWITRLSEFNNIVLTRSGQTNSYIGTADRDSHVLYHQLRREKYGWADQMLALFSGSAAECEGVPVRLELTN